MDIKSMYLAEIEQWMKEHGQPAFRAKQVFQWMHQKYVASTEDMSNLPKALRAQMEEEGFVQIEAEIKIRRYDQIPVPPVGWTDDRDGVYAP